MNATYLLYAVVGAVPLIIVMVSVALVLDERAQRKADRRAERRGDLVPKP